MPGPEPWSYYGPFATGTAWRNEVTRGSLHSLMTLDVLSARPLLPPSLIVHGRQDDYCSPELAKAMRGRRDRLARRRPPHRPLQRRAPSHARRSPPQPTFLRNVSPDTSRRLRRTYSQPGDRGDRRARSTEVAEPLRPCPDARKARKHENQSTATERRANTGRGSAAPRKARRRDGSRAARHGIPHEQTTSRIRHPTPPHGHLTRRTGTPRSVQARAANVRHGHPGSGTNAQHRAWTYRSRTVSSRRAWTTRRVMATRSAHGRTTRMDTRRRTDHTTRTATRPRADGFANTAHGRRRRCSRARKSVA